MHCVYVYRMCAAIVKKKKKKEVKMTEYLILEKSTKKKV